MANHDSNLYINWNDMKNTVEINGEQWSKKEIEDCIELLSKKYYSGYIDYNKSSAINIFKCKLKELLYSV